MKKLVLVAFALSSLSMFGQISCPPGANHCANLTWTTSTGATSYNVYRTLNDQGCSSVTGPNCTKSGSSTTTSYTDSPLSGSTTYFWVVTAVNSAGESAPSNEVTGTTSPDAPIAPTGLTVTVK